MTRESGSQDHSGAGTSYARLASLLERSKEQTATNDEWEGEVRLALRAYLGASTQAHLIPPLLQRLPPVIASDELSEAWSSLSLQIKEKLVAAFKHDPAFLQVSLGLANRLASSSDFAEASRVATSALQALKRPASPALRSWVEGGGLSHLTALVVAHRERFPIADAITRLIVAAESVVGGGGKQTRTQVAAFATEARTLLESGGLDQEQNAIFLNRLGALESEAGQSPAASNRKHARKVRSVPRTEGEAPQPVAHPKTSGLRAGSPVAGVPQNAVGPINPRLVIDSLRQIAGLLEELEERRKQSGDLEQMRQEKSVLERDLSDLQEAAGKQDRIVDALRKSVSELEEAIGVVSRERDSITSRCAGLQESLEAAEAQWNQAERERARLLKELPQQRSAEMRSRIRARIKPILQELDEFQTHPDLPHETLVLLDRYRSLKEILSEEQIADA